MFEEIDNDRQRTFLELYSENGSLKDSAQGAGIANSTPWFWEQSDEGFKTAYQKAKAIYKEKLLDELESELKKRSLDAKERGSIIALIFALKAEAPEKYRDNPPETRLTGDITIKLAVPSYTDNPILPEAPESSPEFVEGDYKYIDKEGENGQKGTDEA